MKLKDYIEDLNELVKQHPEALELDVVCASDDEGNDFSRVHNFAALGYFEPGQFTPESEFKACDMINTKSNAVCLN